MSADHRVLCVYETNTGRSGAPPPTDGEQPLAGDVVLCAGEDDPARRGPYAIPADGVSAWTPLAAFWGNPVIPGTEIYVRGGTVNGQTVWRLNIEEEPVQVGTTPLVWEDPNRAASLAGDGLALSAGALMLEESGAEPGTYASATATVDRFGRVTAVEGGAFGVAAIEGLRLEWLPGGVRVTPGVAWVPGANGGAGGFVELPAAVDVLGGPAGGIRYYYLRAEGDVVGSTTAPSAPYRGDARTLEGNAATRFLGGRRFGPTADVALRFVGEAGFVRYLEEQGNAPLRVLSAGSATSYADVSCAAEIPAGVSRVLARVHRTTAVALRVPGVNADIAAYTAGDSGEVVQLDAARAFRYRNLATGGSTTVDVQGFWEAR